MDNLLKRGGCVFPVASALLTVVFSAAATEFPADLESDVSFWFEGGANVVTNSSGGVEQWWDRREDAYQEGEDLSLRTFVNRRALAYLPDPAGDFNSVPPTLWTDGTRFPGKRFVDFGELGSGRWLGFAQATATCDNLLRGSSHVGAYFAVVGFRGTAGDIVSDVQNFKRKGNKAYFRQEDSSGRGAISSSDPAVSVAFLGETRIDGRRVDPRTEKYRLNDFQLVTQNGPGLAQRGSDKGVPVASTLFNFSNANNQQGGGILGELIAFKRVLTDAERRSVEKYLAAKWFGAEYAARLEAVGETAVDGPMTVDSVSGDGTVVKSGTGKLAVSFQGETPAAAFRLEGGKLQIDQKREPIRLEPVPGTYVSVSGGVYSAGNGEEGVFEVASADENTFLRMDAAAVAAAELRFSGVSLTLGAKAEQVRFAEEPDPLAGSESIVRNGGFETPAISNKSYADLAEESSGWAPSVARKHIVLTRTGSAVFTPTNGAYIAEGLQALAIHPQEGTPSGTYNVPTWAEQTVTAPFDGLYELTFLMTRRPGANRNEGANNVRGAVFVDGKQVFYGAVSTDWRSDQDFFKRFAVDVPLTAGDHVLRLSIHGNNAINRGVLYDDVKLRPIKKGVFAEIPNPGFESCEPITLRSAAAGWFRETPAGTSWNFVPGEKSSSGVYKCGITQHSTWWAHTIGAEEDILRDYRKAYLNFDDSISTTVSVPVSGRYVFTMRYSNRAASVWYEGCKGAQRESGHAVAVSIGGAEIGRAYPVDHHQREYKAVCTLTAGEHELKIAGVCAYDEDGTLKDTTSIIDDVRLRLRDDSGAILKDGDFGGVAGETWSAAGDGPVSIESCMLTLGPGGTLTQTLDIPSNGWYFAEFRARGMAAELTSSNGVYNGALWYPQEIAVVIDGRTVGAARPEDDNAHRYTFALGYLAAGAHEFALTGTRSAGDGARAYLTDVAVRPVAVSENKASDFDLSGTALELADGATLDLQFDGTAELGALRIDGKRFSGLLSSGTMPGLAYGPGALYVPPRGTVITLR